jgi:hypothetical protein
MADPAAIDWLKKAAADARYVVSVCNGAFILAKAGLLDGVEATTTSWLIDRLRVAAPAATVVAKRFAGSGKIVTSGGLSSGIDAALHVVEKARGRPVAEITTRAMEYHWNSDPDAYVAAYRHVFPALAAVLPLRPTPLSVQESASEFVVRLQFSAGRDRADVLKRIAAVVGSNPSWKAATGAPADASRLQYRRTDERSANWLFEAVIEPTAAEAFVVRLAATSSKVP